MPRPPLRTVAHAFSLITLMATAILLAAPDGGAATSQTARCVDTVAKSARLGLNTVYRARERCLNKKIAHKLPSSVDCTADPDTLGGPGTGDAKTDVNVGKILEKRDSRVNKVLRACSGVNPAAAGVADVCSPDASTLTEVAQCAVMDVGKAAADALAGLAAVPRPPSPPPGLAKKCYKIATRALSFNVRAINRIRTECVKDEDEAGASFDCLATVAPPGIVNTTHSIDADENLLRRAGRLGGTLKAFCEDIDLSKLNFHNLHADPTPAPFTLDDLYSVLYDGVLGVAATMDAAVLPNEPYCGNGVTESGEECDDGDRDSCDGCDRDCSTSTCGNGSACNPERCDDGNTSGGDGCDPICVDEVCGNGVVQPEGGEECDDGASNSNTTPDACRTNCKDPSCGDNVVDSGETCDPPNGTTCGPTCTLFSCGNGIVDPGEECDDGASNSDTNPNACRTNCTEPVCGDNVVDDAFGEECDPPDGDVTCLSDCTSANCGNGVLDAGEECDDGVGNSNTAANACRLNCMDPSCGDSVTDDLLGEDCDTGGASPSCDADCTDVVCGDGVINGPAGEGCDDGASNSDTVPDACRTDCNPAGCGDSVIDTGEECDDGNTTGGDGCSALCTCGPGSGEVGCITQDPQCPNLGELTLYAGVGQTCANNGDCPVGECDTGIGRCRTVTDLDTGYTGIAHDADIDDLVVTRGKLLCGNSPTCGECAVTGIDPSTRACRCANDNRLYCDEPFVEDVDNCGLGNICNCYLGQPLPLSAGNTPACAVNRFGQDITGTANVDTGDGTLDVRLRSVVYLGSFLAAPCPVCGGTCTAPAGKVGQACALDRHCDDTPGDGVCGNYDPMVNDGLRGGTCYLGEDQGMDCDVEAVNTTFPANGGGGYSLDCFPVSGTNVSGAGLRINLLQTTGLQSLTANIDCGFPPNFVTECHCSQCSGDETIPCRNNTDCGGAGTCALVGQGIPIPHQCSSLADECMPVGGGEGVCPEGPTDRFCDGFVRANGEGLISCSSNTTCMTPSAEFPSGTGLCTLTKTRPCFLETITAEGMADPNAPIGAAIFCIAQTGSDGINSVAGLPGPGRVINQATSRTFCASDNDVEYVPGVGDCPP